MSQTFSLNKDIIKKLDDLKWETKISQSELLRKVLNYFFENKEELINIEKKTEIFKIMVFLVKL